MAILVIIILKQNNNDIVLAGTYMKLWNKPEQFFFEKHLYMVKSTYGMETSRRF